MSDLWTVVWLCVCAAGNIDNNLDPWDSNPNAPRGLSITALPHGGLPGTALGNAWHLHESLVSSGLLGTASHASGLRGTAPASSGLPGRAS